MVGIHEADSPISHHHESRSTSRPKAYPSPSDGDSSKLYISVEFAHRQSEGREMAASGFVDCTTCAQPFRPSVFSACPRCGNGLDSVPDEEGQAEVPAGWYPDPEGKPAARFWDGEQWTERTRPLVGATGPVAPTVSMVKFGYRAFDDTFHGTADQLFQLAAFSIQQLGWTVVSASEVANTVTFETKMSFGSWSGVTCTITFVPLSPGQWRVAGTGKQNVRGGQLVALDFGESSQKVAKAIERMRQLAPPLSQGTEW